jgi:hypothetical protein
MIYFYLLIPTRILPEKNAEAMPTQRDLGSIRNKIHIQNLEMQVLFSVLLIDMSQQLYKHKKRSPLVRNLALFIFH